VAERPLASQEGICSMELVKHSKKLLSKVPDSHTGNRVHRIWESNTVSVAPDQCHSFPHSTLTISHPQSPSHSSCKQWMHWN